MVQPPLPGMITYDFSYGQNQDPQDVWIELKASGAKVDYHDKTLRKFFIQIPRNKLEEFEGLEQKLQ